MAFAKNSSVSSSDSSKNHNDNNRNKKEKHHQQIWLYKLYADSEIASVTGSTITLL